MRPQLGLTLTSGPQPVLTSGWQGSRSGWSSRPDSSHHSCYLPPLPDLAPSPQKEADPVLPLPGAQYVAEAEEKLQRARLLVESVRKEKVDLSNQLEEERR